MAAPPSVTLDDLTGKFYMNNKLSEDAWPVLTFQGVPYVTRMAVWTAFTYATITLNIKQYTSPEDKQIHIDIKQRVSSMKGTDENRVADNNVRPHEDHIFGVVHGRSLFVPVADVGKDAKDATYLSGEDREFLVSGWDDEVTAEGKNVFVSYVEAEAGWVAWGTWGFATVGEGEERKRMYARRQVVRKPATGESKHIKLFYDYQGPYEEEDEEEEKKEEVKKVGEDYVSDV